MTKLINSKYDKTVKLKILQNKKKNKICQKNVMKLKNQILKKLIKLNCDKTQKLKL